MRRWNPKRSLLVPLAALACIFAVLLGAAGGRSYARRGLTSVSELNLTAVPETPVLFADEDFVALHSGGWEQEADGSWTLRFTARNEDTELREFSLQLLSSAEDLLNTGEETAVRLWAGESEEAYTAVAR